MTRRVIVTGNWISTPEVTASKRPMERPIERYA